MPRSRYSGARRSTATNRRRRPTRPARPRRRYVGRTRRWVRRRPMSRRSLLNTTSRKKNDTMLTWGNITVANPVGGTAFSPAAPVLVGNQQYVIPWCATTRDLNNSVGGANIVINRAERTATTCYMRGLAERVRIQTTDGMPWQWRRVCFTLKGPSIRNLSDSTHTISTETNPGGWRRNVSNWSNIGGLTEFMFRGTVDVDWNDYYSAPLDTTRISVMYDRIRTIAAGNEQGCARTYKMWHPMNHNLVYDDDENGDGEVTGSVSTPGKPGMGDYYVVDFFLARSGSTSTNRLIFNPEASLYWHEK